jgi:broad specificity phosphatase PhoE
MPVILLIRHAQASYGAVDYDVLSELGRQQAAALDAALIRRNVTPALAISGPARRHRDTARLCPQTLGAVELTHDPRWAEYDTDAVLARHGNTSVRIGAPSGADAPTSQEFQTLLDGALEDWLRDDLGGSPSGHTWSHYRQQVSLALNEVSTRLSGGQTAVVFTSAGAIAAVCCCVLSLNPVSFVALNRVQVNTAVTKLVLGRRGTSLVSFNEHGHLEEAAPFLVTSR